MRKFKLFLTLLMLMCIGVTQMWADETVTWAFKTLQTTSGTQDGIAWETGKTGSANATACNSTNGLVLYGVSGGGGYFQTTSAMSGTITNVNIVSTNKKNTPKYTVYCSADGSDWTEIAAGQTAGTKDHAVTGSYTYVKVANTTNATAQLGVTSITVTYSSADPEYTIGAASNNDSWGTVSLSGSVITATPAEGYTYASPAYSVSPANSATVSQNGNAFTVTPSANTTVTINFEAIPTHTVTWSANGSTTTSNFAEGAAIVFPATASGCTGKVFKGWVASPINGETDNEPSYVTSATMGEIDVTYYAVFAEASSGASVSKTYELVLTGSDNFIQSYNARSSEATANEVNGTGTFTVGISSTGVMKSSNSGNPIQFRKQASNSDPGVLYNTTDLGTINSITYGDNSTNNIASTYKGSSQQPTSDGTGGYFQITNGSSVSYITSITINFTKTETGGTSYSNYATSCCTPLASINGSVNLSQSEGSITVSWPATEGGHETGYIVKLLSSSNPEDVVGEPAEVTETSKVFTSVAPGTYYAAVTPIYSGNGNYCAEGTEKVSTASVTVSGEVTVTFKLNGGTVAGNEEKTQNVTISTPTALTSLATLGYVAPDCKEFGGWAISEEKANAATPEVAYADGVNITAAGNTDLWAIWNTKTLSVAQGEGTAVGCEGDAFTFASSVACGGDVEITSSPKATHKGDPTITVLPADAYEEIDGNVIKNVTKAITSISVSYEAKASYNITWNVNGADLTGDALNGVSISVLEGSAIENLPVVANDVLTCTNQFMGWSRNGANPTVPKTASDYDDLFTDGANAGEINADVKFYAVFAKGTASTLETLLSETFDNELANDGTTALEEGATELGDFSGATDKAYKGANGTIKFGSSKAAGYITSKALDLSKDFKVSLKVKKYGTDAANIDVTVGETTKSVLSSEITSEFNSFVLSFDAATTSSTIKIGTSSAYRAYIDDVVVTTGDAGNASNYVTQCAAVAVPTFTVAAGTYNEAQSVELECETEEAEIRYTTNGDAPTSSSTLYEGAIAVNQSMTIKAIAIKNAVESDVNSAAYELQVVDPTISGEANFMESTTVTLACTDANAQIRYTIDGNDPDGESTLYENPFELDATATVKAIAVKAGWTSSAIVEQAFTKIQVLTVAKARDIIDNGTTEEKTGVYANGIVSQIVTAYNSQYGNITYNISADGLTTSEQLQVYRGKGIDGAKFTSADDIKVGDEVVVKGDLTKFSSTYEFSEGTGWLVSLVRTPNFTIAPVENLVVGTENENDLALADLTVNKDGSEGAITLVPEENKESVATVENNVIHPVGAGDITITANMEANGIYKAASTTFTVHVSVPCNNEVTISKGETEHGSFTLDKEEGAYASCEGLTVIVTPTADAHYHVGEVTASNGSVSEPDNDGKYTVTYEQNTNAESVINVSFVENEKKTVTWNVNGNQDLTSQVYVGEKPAFPATPTSCETGENASTTFIGWATAAWEGKAENLDNKTVYTSADDMPAVSAAVEYFAVFAKGEAGAGEEHTITLVESDFGLTTTYAEHTATVGGVGFTVNQGYKGSGNVIQMNSSKGDGTLYNTSAIAGLKSVTINVSSGNKEYTITTGTSQNPTANSQNGTATGTYNAVAGDTYFQLQVSGASYFSSIVVTYTEESVAYTDYMTTCCEKKAVTIDANIENGTVTADPTQACEGDKVTLTPSANPAYHFDAWNVYKTGDTETTVTVDAEAVNDVKVYSFTMPDYAVTVSATFEHDECTQLGTPQNVEVVADYKGAMLDWDDVENADHYVVTIKKGVETVESNTVNVSEYEVAATLLASTTYTYEIQATADDAASHCPSALATDDFETEGLPSFNLTLMENGIERAEDAEYTKSHVHGEPFDLPATATSACTGKVFVGWSDKAEANAAEDLISGQVSLTKDSTLYAVYATETPGEETITSDVLDRALTGKTSTQYGDWSGKKATTDAVYAGNSAGGNESIQLRSNNSNSGIVTTTSGGKAKKVTVVWQDATDAGRTIDIYGYNSAYSAPTELYGNSAKGTNLGSIVKGTSTELVISGDYEYIGIRSKSGALYLSSVTIDWATGASASTYSDYTTSCAAQLADLTFSPEAGEFTEAQTITISGPQGATIYYTVDGTEPTTESAVFSEAITINKCGENTIKAFAKDGNSESAVATATYTLNLSMRPNSQEAPYTPAQAIAVYEGNGYCYSGDSVYVKGVVKTSSGLSSQYGNYDNIVVVAEETTSPEFTFFHMYKGAGKVQFTSEDVAIEANDTIEAYGVMTYYAKNGIYEFTDGCYLIGEVKKYAQPKTPIESSLENPITIAAAIDYIDNQGTYDLSQEVYVKAVANAAPTNAGTFTGHDANVEPENSFQFYNTNLDKKTIVANDTVIVKGIIKIVNTNYRMDAGVVQEVKAYVAPIVPKFTVNPLAVAFGDVEQGASVEAIQVAVELTAIESATVALADENNVFSIDVTSLIANGTITVTANSNVDIANYAATITLQDEAGVAEDVEIAVSMNVTAVETRHIAVSDPNGFTEISGDLTPADIKFAAYKGGSQTAPSANNNAHQLRLYKYQATTDFGGYLTLKAVKGCTIDQAQITVGGNCKVDYSVNAAAIPTKENEGQTIGATTPLLTEAGLNADSIRIANIDENSQFQIVSIKVWYNGEAAAVDHYTLVGVPEVAPEFPKNGEFNHDGITVWACYDANCEDKVDITAQCEFVANLSAEGTTAVSVQLNSVEVATYDITVISGQDDPALAWKRDEAVISEAEVIAAADVASWVAPTLRNELNVSPISFSSNKPAVATVDENGFIALAGGYGTATITATFEETEDYIASEATYTITIQEPANKIAGDWRLVTSPADITIGSKVIIVGTKTTNNIATKYAMGEQKQNNRAAVAIVSEENGVITAKEGTKTFTLEDAGDGKYAFKANNGMYLYAAGSGNSNYLKEQAMINGDASWTITITGEGTTIQANGTHSNNLLRMNPNGQNNPLFSCYSNGQNPVTLYVNRTVIPGSNDPEHPADSVIINTNVEEEEIVVSGNIVVTVDAENFVEPKSYIAQNGATIIVNNADEAKSIIADTTSTIEVSSPTTVNQTFSVAATMGGGVSGQIAGASNVTIAESTEAYFDITLGANATSSQWHAFAVPFPVDALNGIYDAATGAKLTNEVNYAIMDYHGDIRATGAYGWKKYRGILQPGVFYLMTVDGDTKTFRFKMSGLDLQNLTSLALQLYANSGDGQSTDAGWNGVANPMLEHGTVNQTVYVLNPNSYTYEDHDAGSYNFVVGTPFFIQANAQAVSEGMEMGAVDDTKPYYAPKHVSENGIEKMKVFFGNDKYQDKLTISANEDALNEYEIGKDLIKMTMTNTPKVAQIFGNAYGTKLCRANLPLVNDAVSMEIDLYVPETGEYAISTAENANATVYLTREDAIIWNLSTSEYTGSFEKGNNAGYGIRIVKAPQVITGVEQSAVSDQQSAQKIIIDEHVYILRGEQLFDVTGKSVK